jgi:hypothetical protein
MISRLKGEAESARGYLHHLVDGFWRDEEKNFPRQGHDSSLLGNIVGLALEGEL